MLLMWCMPSLSVQVHLAIEKLIIAHELIVISFYGPLNPWAPFWEFPPK